MKFTWLKSIRVSSMILVGLLIVIAMSTCACTKESSKESTMPAFMDNVGKTFNTIKTENPGYVYGSAVIVNASGQCFGDFSDTYVFGCFFFGVHDVPSLEDVVNFGYGDQLRCAGIVTSVKEMFPAVGDSLSVADFQAIEGVSDYYCGNQEMDIGWVYCHYNGYVVSIDATVDDVSVQGEFWEADVIKGSYPIWICDTEIRNANYELRNEAAEMMYR